MASKRSKKSKKSKSGRAPPRVDIGRPRLVRADGGPSPDAAGDGDTMLTERASATPLAPATAPSEAPVPAKVVAGVEGPFVDLLDWFSCVATHPRSAVDGVLAATPIQERLGAETVEAIVKPNDRMTAIERMDLYQYAYHARLVECLADDYPSIVEALGRGRFDMLARKYIEAFPSTHPNLNAFGRNFASFCDTQGAWLDHYRFIRDLARLEWAIVEIIHAPSGDPVSMTLLEHTPQERWAEIRLPPSPTLRFLELEYPANSFLQAQRKGQHPAIPNEGWSATAVYRSDYTVWRMGFTKPMAAVLQALIANETLGNALGRLEDPQIAADVGETDVMLWFKEWVMNGFFERVAIA